MSNGELFDRYEALTFDDVVIVPGYSDVLPDTADTSATFADDIVLQVPIVSAAMDKVTEARMAIAMAREGGIGVIHRNLSIADQAAEVQKVKRSQSGMITDPVTLPPTATLADAEALMSRFKFSGMPITDPDGRLVGILTNRDMRFCEQSDYRRLVTEFMTSDGLVTAHVGTTLRRGQGHPPEAPHREAAAGRRGRPPGRADHGEGHPQGHRVPQRHPRRGPVACAAPPPSAWAPIWRSGSRCWWRMGVDAVALDTAHGHSAGVLKAIERIKGSWPDLPVAAGNVVTEDGVEALHKAGASAVKVGVGAGSICTTRVVSGAGMPQLSAIHFAARKARQLGIPVIGDGGITYSGDVVKAIAAGADCVMLGSLLAGTDEAPGELELFEGRRYKSYRGMGSMGAMQGLGADRYATAQSADGQSQLAGTSRKLVPEGIEGRVPYAGTLGDVVYQLVGGLRSGMGYAGAATLDSLRNCPVHAGHHRRPQREPPSRRDDHQGSSQLPAQLIRPEVSRQERECGWAAW